MLKYIIKGLAYVLKPIVKQVLAEIEMEAEVKELGSIVKLNNAMAEATKIQKAKVDNYLSDRKIKQLNQDIVNLNVWAAEHKKQKEALLSKTKIKPMHRIPVEQLHPTLKNRLNSRRPETNKEFSDKLEKKSRSFLIRKEI